MKKIGFLLLFILGVSSFTSVFADYSLNLEQFLSSYFNVIIQKDDIPSSYKYIQLKYMNISPTTPLYKTLQKAVYLDLFPNARMELPLKQIITQQQATAIIKQGFDGIFTGDEKQPVTLAWLRNVLLDIQDQQIEKGSVSSPDSQGNSVGSSSLFQDVYTRLTSSYISSSGIDEKKLLYGSIKGMVDGLNDPYTSFFPPTEATQFSDELGGEYYGIGTYIEMSKPGELIITSPITGTPAEKAGLKPGDKILQIDKTVVNQDVSLNMAVNLIKGSSGSKVSLKVLRGSKIISFEIERTKIVLQNIETKVSLSDDKQQICLITIRMFDFGVSRDFDLAMKDLSQKNCAAYIFDVRNNPGGSLEEVDRMLNYFVPTGQTSIIVKSPFHDEKIIAWDSPSSKITDKKIRVLINKGSASASEIFAGVVKEYSPNTLLIGEQTFGKGSVQELLRYDDGSMLKYTVAKRYTGKGDKNIDKVGFSPDVSITDSTGTVADEVLDYAINH